MLPDMPSEVHVPPPHSAAVQQYAAHVLDVPLDTHVSPFMQKGPALTSHGLPRPAVFGGG